MSRTDRSLIRFVVRAYHLWLYTLGRDFRTACGPAMEQTFRTVCTKAAARGGARSVLGVVTLEFIDVVAVALRERLRGLRAGIRGVMRGSGPRDQRSGRTTRHPLADFFAQFVADIRQAIRALAKRPGYSAIALLTLGIGIGANTAIFSVVDTVLLRPLPYEDPDNIYMVWNHIPEKNMRFAAHRLQHAREWREQTQIFQQVELHDTESFILTGSGEPELINGAYLSTGMLPFLGVQPSLGRNFTVEEREPGRDRVVILSDGLWRTRYGADPDILGQTLRLGPHSYAIIGIMPSDFRFPTASTKLWLPVADNASGVEHTRYFRVLARLRDGIALEQAQQSADLVAERLQEARPRDAGWYIQLGSYDEIRLRGRSRPVFVVLSAAVGFVLLIACANIANLSLSVAASRQREMAIRSALGAGRFRILRHVLTENLLLGLAGGFLGVLLAYWSVPLLVRLAPSNYTFLTGNSIAVDGRILVFAFAAAVMSGLLSGIIPAVRASRVGRLATLGNTTRSPTATGAQHRLRSSLVVLQVGLSLVLLAGAGLMMKSFAKLNRIDVGYNPDNLITLWLELLARYPNATERTAMIDALQDQLALVPGVEGVARAGGLPPTGLDISFGVTPEAEGYPVPSTGGDFVMPSQSVGPDYFRVMQIDLLDGRAFTPSDTHGDVVIVNDAMVNHYWQGNSPVGKRFRVDAKDGWHTVVGVVGDVRFLDSPVDQFGEMEMYYPMGDGWNRHRVSFALRTNANPTELVQPIKQRIWQLDPQLPVPHIYSMEQRLSDALAEPRFLLTLTTLFAFVALTLAAIGLYGVIAYVVTQRTNEIGIRMALGARVGNVLGLVLRYGMLLALLGTLLGLVGAFWLTRLLDTMLFEVSPTDPRTFGAVAIVLIAVSLVASYLPARRATRVDPMVALRTE